MTLWPDSYGDIAQVLRPALKEQESQRKPLEVEACLGAYQKEHGGGGEKGCIFVFFICLKFL